MPRDSGLELAGFEDYRQGVGRLENGVLRIRLEAREAAWRPWGNDGATLRTHVFAADGAPPRTPAPLIRVRVGTPVHITVRNGLEQLLLLRGLRDRDAIPADAPRLTPLAQDSVAVAPGRTAELHFTPTEPGTFAWFGRTLLPGEAASVPSPVPLRPADRALWGVLIVDPEGSAALPDEGIFLMTHWADPELPGTFLPATRFFINGRSWPHTERLEYAVGDTIRWRVINGTGREHPMHLHGAHFRVDARGDQLREHVFPEPERRLAVTEVLALTQTMRLSWVAHEPGNWLFHCHFMRHMSAAQTSPPDAPPVRHAPPGAEGVDLMGGLVLGVTVRRPLAYEPAVQPTRRRLELESWADGVPGWSGTPGRTVPAIPPGDSLIVRMTPPRAGTFMYHVHSEPGHQLAQGLYGPFLVLEPGAPWDPETDRFFLLGSLGAGEDAPPAINGERRPQPLELHADATYRMRFMHISPDDDKQVSLLAGDEPATWRSVAKDGADLPPHQVRSLPAELRIGVGETYDFLWSPEPGEYTLRVVTTFDGGAPLIPREAPPPDTTTVRITVRDDLER